MISTCSYAGWRPEHGTPVRITLGRPRWPEPNGRARWIYLAELAPAGWYFRAAPEKFGRCYLSQLNRFAADIDRKIIWLAEAFGPITLLCFERKVRPGDCHRLLAAGWLQDRLGCEIPELDGRR